MYNIAINLKWSRIPILFAAATAAVVLLVVVVVVTISILVCTTNNMQVVYLFNKYYVFLPTSTSKKYDFKKTIKNWYKMYALYLLHAFFGSKEQPLRKCQEQMNSIQS